MKKPSLALALIAFAFAACPAQAQSIYEPYAFTTLAGLALNAGATDDTGNLARFDQPWGLAVDNADNVYVADTLNHTIRKITPAGVVTTLAGIAGSSGYNDGAASTALFNRPTGVAVNNAGTVVYVADYNNHLIRQIAGGVVTTLAGSVGVAGSADGTGTAAQFHNPFGVALSSDETLLYVADQNNQTIRTITLPGGVVTTLAGAAGVNGSTDDPVNNLNARFNTPRGIAVDGSGNVYVADAGNLTVRKIAAGGGVSTLAGAVFTPGFADGVGSVARFSLLQAMSPFGGPCGVAVDGAGSIYVTDQGNHTVRKITPGDSANNSVTTLAGLALTSGSDDGLGSDARFNDPAGIAVDSTGNLFVADTLNHTIRIGVKASPQSCITFDPPTNKIVECGSAWDFDAPTNIIDTCCTNYVLTFATETNSWSPPVITRTWTVSDTCGNTNTCSQTVTLTGTSPITLLVSATNNIFGAGHAIAPNPGGGSGGTLPPSYSFTAGPGKVLAFASVTGTATLTICCASSGADGYFNITDTDISSYGGISGIKHNGAGFLVGVFLGPDEPADPAPPVLDFTASALGTGFSQLSPVIGQTFYIGDGLTGTGSGSVQQFEVPPTATRLFLGFADAESYHGDPGAYEDNGGVLTATFEMRAMPTCGSNKTVDCGTAWDFDAPDITNSCSDTVTVLSTETNGVCPMAITRAWLVADGFVSNICSQTVTVVDTTPPVVTCPTNALVVALDANCQLVIPTIQPKATDNCTPTSQLVYTQNPPAGTVWTHLQVPIVTVTVQDACGNTSQCQVRVIGQDKTPPVVIAPERVTLTNCLVPDVLALVSAADNCTASNRLVIAQYPPAGSDLVTAGSQVSVTVTDQAGNTTTQIIPLTSGGPQSFLAGLFNTGVNNNNVVLPSGSVDPHYSLGPVPAGIQTGPGYYNAPDALVATSPWGLPPFTLSRWIAPFTNSIFSPSGSFTYTNQFTLPQGADPLTASISGRWAADNGATMYLNGLAPANQVSTIATPTGFSQWTSFTASSGFLAFPAINKLYCVVTNEGIYTGLRVEFTDAMVNCSTCAPPAIIYTKPDQSLPLGSSAVLYVTAWGTPPLTVQWYHNGLPLSNGGHYSGVNTTSLTVTPLSYADAGTYYALISNACGETASRPRKLTVTRGWPWWWAWWHFAVVDNPLVATVGPNLVLHGTNVFGLSSGSTRDFGLPNLGGQPANVLYVPPLPGDTFIQLPSVGPTGSELVGQYTLIMDVLVPGDSANPVTLFSLSDQWGHLKLATVPGAAGYQLNLSGLLGSTNINVDSSVSLRPDAWNRVGLVVDGSGDPGTVDNANEGTLTAYLNGAPMVRTLFDAASGVNPLLLGSNSVATVWSSSDGNVGAVFVAGLQFHAVAMPPEMIASIGSPDNGPLLANDPSAGAAPVLSAVQSSDGMVHLSWKGSAFQLQETSDLAGVTDQQKPSPWVNSALPFDQAEMNGEVMTTAHANPTLGESAKFYRLIYKP